MNYIAIPFATSWLELKHQTHDTWDVWVCVCDVWLSQLNTPSPFSSIGVPDDEDKLYLTTSRVVTTHAWTVDGKQSTCFEPYSIWLGVSGLSLQIFLRKRHVEDFPNESVSTRFVSHLFHYLPRECRYVCVCLCVLITHIIIIVQQFKLLRVASKMSSKRGLADSRNHPRDSLCGMLCSASLSFNGVFGWLVLANIDVRWGLWLMCFSF